MSKKRPFHGKTNPKSGSSKNQTKRNQKFSQKFSQKENDNNKGQDEKPDLTKLNQRIKESKFLRNLRKKNTPNRTESYSRNQLANKLVNRSKNPSKAKSRFQKESDQIRLNKYIADAGVCSRREADKLIQSGVISVNGKVITELGFKVSKQDKVYHGKKLLQRENFVYVLLNKPKDFITTTNDPQNRRTVMHLVAKAANERLYPVGRLDRDTTGLLLLTNDGNLAQKLSHPSNEVRKIYQIEVNKPIINHDIEQIASGLKLEDGTASVDKVVIINAEKTVIGIEIHLGRNRIIRRIFEHLGYEVLRLDRTSYAGLTKKDLPRGRWRYLTEKEIIRLKFFM